MEQYTAKQWAEIEGGHSMSETNQPQFGFLNDLNEASKLYRTRQQLDTADLRDTLNFAFVNLLTLQILYSNYNTAPIAQDYAKRTLIGNGNFKTYRRDGTDLYHALHKISTKSGGGDKRAQIQSAKTQLPEQQLKQYLKAIASGQQLPQVSGLFMRIERGLDITEANYKAMRRMAVNWNGLPPGQKTLLATRMLQYYRANAIRSELYPSFKKFASAGNFYNPSIDSVEKDITARKVATRAAAATAAFAGGFAGGRAFGRSLV
jgi:hypothetical protein